MRGNPDHYSDQPNGGSRRRLWLFAGAGTAAVTLLVVVAVTSQAATVGEQGTPTPSPTPTTSTISTASSSPSPGATATGTVAPEAGDVVGTPTAAAVDAAGRFVDAWLSHGNPVQRRVLLTPVAVPALVEGLVQTDPAVLPVGRRVGVAVFRSGGDQAAIYRVQISDGSAVLVDLVVDGAGGWKATAIQPDPDS